MKNMSIAESNIVRQHRLSEPGTIMTQPHNMITFARQSKRVLSWRNEYVNRMFWVSLLDNLNGGNHIAICRNDDGNVATLCKHIC